MTEPTASEREEVVSTLTSASQSGAMKLDTTISPSMVSTAEIVRIEDGPFLARVSLGDEFSNVTVQLDDPGEITHYTETHVSPISETSGHVRVLTDGAVTVDRVFHDGELAASYAAAGASTAGMGPWGALNRCLSIAGIASWLVAAAMVACGSTPVGAVVCLVGAGIGAGTASYCVRWAVRHG